MASIWRIFVEYLVSLSRRRNYIVILQGHHIRPSLACIWLLHISFYSLAGREPCITAFARIHNVLFIAFCTTIFGALQNIANCSAAIQTECSAYNRPDAR